ncbi:hypothetical protein [Secundilactobacillus kimchicus]
MEPNEKLAETSLAQAVGISRTRYGKHC